MLSVWRILQGIVLRGPLTAFDLGNLLKGLDKYVGERPQPSEQNHQMNQHRFSGFVQQGHGLVSDHEVGRCVRMPGRDFCLRPFVVMDLLGCWAETILLCLPLSLMALLLGYLNWE